MVKDFIVANRCVEFGLAVGAIRNFIQLCEGGFTFETLPFVMGFYFALLCLNDCLDSAITWLNLLCWSYGPFTVVSHSLFEQLVPTVVEF